MCWILTGGWAYGMAATGSSYPASDLRLVFTASLLFAIAPVLGVSATIYALKWQFSRMPSPLLSQSASHDDVV